MALVTTASRTVWRLDGEDAMARQETSQAGEDGWREASRVVNLLLDKERNPDAPRLIQWIDAYGQQPQGVRKYVWLGDITGNEVERPRNVAGFLPIHTGNVHIQLG